MRTGKISKSICCILTATSLFACTQEVIETLPTQAESETQSTEKLAKYRTYEEALAVAQDAIGMLGESCVTRSGNPRTIDIHNVQYIVNTSSTRSDGKPDTLMYVFNYDDNAGFAVVSANRATEELIAVTEQGNYIAGEETGNGGFDLYMDMAETYIQTAAEPLPPVGGGDNGPVGFKQVKYETTIDTTIAGPYLNVQWGQKYPYNLYCPQTNGVKDAAGCVATAIAQIMSYYKHPSSITISYETPSYSYLLDWDAMLMHRSSNECNCDSHEMIGKFIREIGNLVYMDYGPQSGTDISNAANAFSVLGYKHDALTSYSSSKLINSLRQKKLVYMAGAGMVDNEMVGHAWVVDGYKSITYHHTEYMKEDYEILWTITNQSTETFTYHHINWGWNGISNGYFSKDVFDTSSPVELDEDVFFTANFDFTNSLYIFPNIEIR
ncbi:MAG: C10 family peptidase [Bacteroidaceae bacterium]|nr:C10 family peptidase [Bacteroidaceae bacterium]